MLAVETPPPAPRNPPAEAQGPIQQPRTNLESPASVRERQHNIPSRGGPQFVQRVLEIAQRDMFEDLERTHDVKLTTAQISHEVAHVADDVRGQIKVVINRTNRNG